MKKIVLAMAALIIGNVFIGCKKYGCTDPNALNFEDRIRTNNLNCTYEGSVLFWYDQITYDSLKALYNHKSLEYYINDVQRAILDFENPQSGIPRCGSSEVFSFTDSLNHSYKKYIHYTIKTETGILLYDSIAEITGNECLKIQLL